MSNAINLSQLRNVSLKNLRKGIQNSSSKQEQAQVLQVKVEAAKHCNLDSLPLRFGFYENADFILDVTPHSELMKSNRDDRHLLDGEIVNPHSGKRYSGQFVFTKKQENGYPILVTAWRHGIDTELYLSETMRQLRRDGLIDSEWLLSQHEKYNHGELRSSGDLVALLAKKLSGEQLASAQKSEKAVVEQYKNEAETAERLLRETRAEAQEQNDKNQARIEFLEAENTRLLAEQSVASSESYVVSTTGENVLVSVQENFLHRGSSCTAVSLSNGETWYMKTSTFDKDGTVTEQAKLLIGNPVKLSSWDPVSSPGYWSSQFYFRNIYLAK